MSIDKNQLVTGIKVCIPTSQNPDSLEDELYNLDNYKSNYVFSFCLNQTMLDKQTG
ncbi:hypothetical protein [Nostoc sp.]|uniref:hypothetical protein n=1 Tax=Nostoc sp. TaxID=1180 RepID=UPI002FF8AC79